MECSKKKIKKKKRFNFGCEKCSFNGQLILVYYNLDLIFVSLDIISSGYDNIVLTKVIADMSASI